MTVLRIDVAPAGGAPAGSGAAGILSGGGGVAEGFASGVMRRACCEAIRGTVVVLSSAEAYNEISADAEISGVVETGAGGTAGALRAAHRPRLDGGCPRGCGAGQEEEKRTAHFLWNLKFVELGDVDYSLVLVYTYSDYHTSTIMVL